MEPQYYLTILCTKDEFEKAKIAFEATGRKASVRKMTSDDVIIEKPEKYFLLIKRH